MSSASDPAASGRFLVLMPVFDDWDAARAAIARLEAELAGAGIAADLLLVDDGSPTQAPADLVAKGRSAIGRVEVLRLKRNLGHQRALAVGLCFVGAERPDRDVIAMDADGEDLPSDVPRLVEAFRQAGGEKAVFARRLRRSEGPVFAASYHLYRVLHQLLTGIPVEVGNFSVLPAAFLPKLGVASELWNHYAATVVKLGIPRVLVDAARGPRLGGRSKMSFVSLVAHGVGAMSVFADRIGVRLLIAAGTASALVLGMVGAVSLRWLTDSAIPGWLAPATGVLLVLVTQLITAALIFVLIVHQGRAGVSIVPARDVEVFIESHTILADDEAGS